MNNYPGNWREIADKVKREAGYRCVRCGHPHETPTTGRIPCDERCDPERHRGGLNDGKQRILTVHHLTMQKNLNVWWNTVALCQVCHLQIQGKVTMDQMYPFEHSDWFKPYAAGWYAYKYLGQDLTREEVESRLDELLALELAL